MGHPPLPTNLVESHQDDADEDISEDSSSTHQPD